MRPRDNAGLRRPVLFPWQPGSRKLLEEGGLRVAGTDPDGEVRILELPGPPFYVATLFVPQLRSSRDDPHPLIAAFVEACLTAKNERARERTV